MNTDEHGFLDSLTGRILGAVFEVSNTLGAGFLEKVYERGLLLELRLRGIGAVAQASFPLHVQRSVRWRVFCRYSGRAFRGDRAKVRRGSVSFIHPCLL
jgi:PD-(D/E)XK nuclease superfamily